MLRTARERRGETLETLAAALRIRREHLAAIEDGRLRDLPGKTYAIGFIRSYARHVGLDAAKTIEALKARATDIPATPELNFRAPVSERRLPSGALIAASLVLAVGVYGGWYYLNEPMESVSLVSPPPPLPADREIALAKAPPPPAAPDEMAQEPPPAAETGESADMPMLSAGAVGAGPETSSPSPPWPLSSLAATPGGLDGGRVALAIPQARSGGPAQAAEVPPARGPVLAALPDVVANGQSEPSGRTLQVAHPNPAQVAATSRVVLRAAQDSWIQINVQGGDRTLLARLLRAGDSVVLPGAPDLRLTTGNAGGLEILVDGAFAPQLGASGVVIRNVSLDGARLLAGTAVGH